MINIDNLVSPGNGLIQTWLDYTNTVIEQSAPTFPTIQNGNYVIDYYLTN